MTERKAPAIRVGFVAFAVLLGLAAGAVAYYAGWIGGGAPQGKRKPPAPVAAQAEGPLLFDLQGHRGARGLAPENTLAGFRKALEIGVDTLELDLAMTRDGVLVVSHDPALNPAITRWPDGNWLNATGPAIRSLTLAEVQRFDVGRIDPDSRYGRMFPDQEPADGERIPTLKEVVDLARGLQPAIRFNIEIKIHPGKPAETADAEEFAAAVAAFVREEGLLQSAVVQAFDYRPLLAIRHIEPRIVTACLSIQRPNFDNVGVGQPGPSPWTAGLDVDGFGGSVPRLAQAAGCAVWSPHWRDLNAEKAEAARALGLKVIPWTVNTPEDIAQMLSLPIDGIITDYPDRVRAAMAERGIKSR